MDFNELKENAQADLSALVLSLSAIIKMMITMFSGVMVQNEKLTTTILDLQETKK